MTFERRPKAEPRPAAGTNSEFASQILTTLVPIFSGSPKPFGEILLEVATELSGEQPSAKHVLASLIRLQSKQHISKGAQDMVTPSDSFVEGLRGIVSKRLAEEKAFLEAAKDEEKRQVRQGRIAAFEQVTALTERLATRLVGRSPALAAQG